MYGQNVCRRAIHHRMREVVIFDHGLKRKDEIDLLTFKGTCLVYKKK